MPDHQRAHGQIAGQVYRADHGNNQQPIPNRATIAHNFNGPPACGPVLGEREGRVRFLLGWSHTDDTPARLIHGQIWCSVNKADKLMIYLTSGNRSKIPGTQVKSGSVNFTWVEMFHPYWCLDGYVAMDMAWLPMFPKDKAKLRELYRRLQRERFPEDFDDEDIARADDDGANVDVNVDANADADAADRNMFMPERGPIGRYRRAADGDDANDDIANHNNDNDGDSDPENDNNNPGGNQNSVLPSMNRRDAQATQGRGDGTRGTSSGRRGRGVGRPRGSKNRNPRKPPPAKPAPGPTVDPVVNDTDDFDTCPASQRSLAQADDDQSIKSEACSVGATARNPIMLDLGEMLRKVSANQRTHGGRNQSAVGDDAGYRDQGVEVGDMEGLQRETDAEVERLMDTDTLPEEDGSVYDGGREEEYDLQDWMGELRREGLEGRAGESRGSPIEIDADTHAGEGSDGVLPGVERGSMEGAGVEMLDAQVVGSPGVGVGEGDVDEDMEYIKIGSEVKDGDVMMRQTGPGVSDFGLSRSDGQSLGEPIELDLD